jgi:hypothetical protein
LIILKTVVEEKVEEDDDDDDVEKVDTSAAGNKYFPMKNEFINDIDIQILDENSKFLDFNNMSWVLVFQILMIDK